MSDRSAGQTAEWRAPSGVAYSDAPLPVASGARASDGTWLAEFTWRPASGMPHVGSLLLVHGLGEHSRRYGHVAESLVRMGLVVRAYDHRGFGASGGRKATLPSHDALLDDARGRYLALASAMAAEGDERPPFVLGHSMGGCVVARAVTGGWIDAPRGVVLSAPALVPRVNAVERVTARVGSRHAPGLRLPHMLPLHRLSHDPAVVLALAADKLVHDRVTPRLVQFMLDAGARAIADAPRCTTPTLLLVAGDDRLVDPDGARRFHARLPAGVGELHEYPSLYHELFQERATDRARVISDLDGWLRSRLAAR